MPHRFKILKSGYRAGAGGAKPRTPILRKKTHSPHKVCCLFGIPVHGVLLDDLVDRTALEIDEVEFAVVVPSEGGHPLSG